MATSLIAFRPDNKLVLRLERLAESTGRSKSYFLNEALQAYLDTFEKEYLSAQQALDQAKSKKEVKMNTDDESMTQKLARFETAQETCGLMAVIRRDWIDEEEQKALPDQAKIQQWEEEERRFILERLNLRFDNVEEQERIFREYSPQIRAHFQQPAEVEPVRAAA